MTMKKLKQYNDDELIAMYAQGCNEAFDTLLMRYDAYIHSYIRYSVQDEDLVEDIFQDAFIKVMTTIKAGRYTESARFKQWLTRITHNLIMDSFRRRKSLAKYEGFVEEGEFFSAFRNISSDELNSEELMIHHDSIGELHQLLARLPQDQQEVVRLRIWEDKSFKEIADTTGVSINTALGRMRYALNNLRKGMCTSL